MDNVAVSRRKNAYNTGNKENTQPEHGGKSLLREDKPSVTRFQPTHTKKEQNVVRHVPLTAKVATRPVSAGAITKTQKRAAVTQRQTHSQAFFTEQTVRQRNMVAEAPKPPAAAPASRSAPGMYKGRIVQSKIGSMWKSTASGGGADHKAQGQKVGHVIKSRVKSEAASTQDPAIKRSKSVQDRPAHPPARTVQATQATASSRDTRVAPGRGPTKGSGTHTTKPKMANKPVTSTLSQHRLCMETAEERRAKLAQWLTSKGKTLKRPAMTAPAEPTRTRADPKQQSRFSVQPVVECNPEPEPRPATQKPDVAPCADRQALATHDQTPVIMKTTLDLLDVSDLDPEDSVDDVVVNLCDALEAIELPSRCDEHPQVTDVCSGAEEDKEVKNDSETELKEEKQDAGEQLEVEQVTSGEGEKLEPDEEGESVMENASVIKYSVKTTPYLQSVKKTIDGDSSTSRSKRKRNIKDLKFLTPVRRSCRIERRSSHLPAMLVDPDPCVSSLAELLKLDDDPNAYICRKNPALLVELPDCKEL